MIEILEANYWEHFKFAKELAMFLPVDHPKRVMMDKVMAEMINKINQLKP